MNYHSDTVQTSTLGLAFFALFIVAIAGLQVATGSALYNTQIAEAAEKESVVSDKAETETVKVAFAGEWMTYFASVAFAASEQVGTASVLNMMDLRGNEQTPKEVHKKAQDRAKRSQTDNPVMTQTDKREILWLARIMYSETKRADEQRIIGWVVRNRVDTGYTGRTYESVAKHSRQFSGLHPSDARYEHNISRWYASDGISWETALEIAKDVYFADESDRPLALTTRHFYSPNAVSRTPAWAEGQEAVKLLKDPTTGMVRFALYDKVR